MRFNNPSNFAKDLMPRLSRILTEAIKEARYKHFSSLGSSLPSAAGPVPHSGFSMLAECWKQAGELQTRLIHSVQIVPLVHVN